MRLWRASLLGVTVLWAVAAAAQDRITPEHGSDASILSTRTSAPVVEPLQPLPWLKDKTPAAAAPTATPAKAPFGGGSGAGSKPPMAVPFGRATPMGNPLPTGPHTSIAVPVPNVDAVEVSEPAPATPMETGADPAQENPETPTDLTSPIFEGGQEIGGPRIVTFRVLNKVMAQSAVFKAKSGQTAKFGKLEVTAVMCRISIPTSQTDYAALLDIRETLPGKEETMKPLFRGWMYASSPSVTALEHPIYDVTMVNCELPEPDKKAEEKPEKKAPALKKK